MTVEELLARCELVRASETIVTAFSLSNITLSQVLTYNSLYIVNLRWHPREYTAFLAEMQWRPHCLMTLAKKLEKLTKL